MKGTLSYLAFPAWRLLGNPLPPAYPTGTLKDFKQGLVRLDPNRATE
jgi:hypothetical protein